jgi:hypothetical protein
MKHEQPFAIKDSCISNWVPNSKDVELAPLYFSRDQLTTEAYFDATDGT